MKTIGFIAIFLVISLISDISKAQGRLGEKGQIVLGAERIFGMNHWSVPSSDGKRTGWSMGFGVRPDWTTTSAIPRLSIDGFVSEGVSFGGGFGAFYYEGNAAFILAPRIGGTKKLREKVTLWYRGGLFFAGESTLRIGGVAAAGELAFIFSPVDGFGFIAEGTCELGLPFTSLGINAGIAGWF